MFDSSFKIRKGGQQGFTLVELLTVLAIIALLASVLFPVFAQAREKGRQTACASGLRQLAIANQMYAQDFDGHFVPAAPDFFLTDNRRWFGVFDALANRWLPQNGSLVPYLKDGGALRQCPSFAAKQGFALGTGGMVYNYLGIGSRVWWMGFQNAAFDDSAKESDLSRPASVAMFADGAIDTGEAGGAVEYGLLEPPYAVIKQIPGAYPLEPSVHFRHHGRANVVFADAHLHSLSSALSTSESVYPGANPAAHGLGWFGPAEGETYYTP